MEILYLMIICSVSLAVVFLIIFIVNARNGQFEDDESPAIRMLLETEVVKEKKESDSKSEENI